MANVVIRPGERWDLEHLMAGIDPGNTVVLADEAIEAIRCSSKGVDSITARPALLYGVNSGFGALANVRVRPGDKAELQRRHILSHAALDSAVPSMQDPYSFRCIPQVHGAVREHIAYAQNSILNEINTTADNPLFFVDDDLALLGGNLHGESVAMAADMLGIAATELAAISERRTYQLLSGRRSLLDFLTEDPGVNSGLMISQYSAAALVSEAKTLAHPGSVDSIPTCQLQDDHVSMGGTSVLKLRQIVDNLEYVLAIELMTGCQAADLKAGLVLSPAVRGAQERCRTRVPRLTDDRVLAGDIEHTRQFLRHDLASDLVAEETAAAGAREEAGR
jgi:histidine ammonia-lyase